MRLLTYQIPDELLAIASAGEFDEFDLNEFFAATGTGTSAHFKHKNDVQKWLDIIRGSYAPPRLTTSSSARSARRFHTPTFVYLPYLQHSLSFLPNVAACHARGNLLPRSTTPSGTTTRRSPWLGLGRRGTRCIAAVRSAIGSGFETKTITPVVSLPHESVIVFVSKPLPIAGRTGGKQRARRRPSARDREHLVVVPEGVVLLGEKVRHRMTRSDIRKKPERVLKVRQQSNVGVRERRALGAELEVVDLGGCVGATDDVEPLLDVVLVLELEARARAVAAKNSLRSNSSNSPWLAIASSSSGI